MTAVTDQGFYFSPYNWTSQASGGVMQANNVKAGSTHVRSVHRGAYLKMALTSTSASSALTLTWNPSRLANGETVTVFCLVNGGATKTATLTNASSATFTLSDGLAVGSHRLLFWVEAFASNTDRWTTPTCAFEIQAITLPAGVTAAPVATYATKNMLVFGDSITDGGQSYWYHTLANALGCEVGGIGFASQGYEVGNVGVNVPKFSTAWSSYDSTQSRLVSGLLSPQPDYIVVSQGQNDADGAVLVTSVTNTLAAISAAAPNARMVCNVPFSGVCRASITAATRPANCILVDTAPARFSDLLAWYTSDNIHPNDGGHGFVAGLLQAKIRAAYGSFGSFAGRRF